MDRNIPRRGLFERLRAAFMGSSLTPAMPVCTRMPDLERWAMPHRVVDMGDWTVALNMARNALRPDRTRLLDLYDSILVDSHLASVIDSRVLRVRRSRYRLIGADGQPKPELLPLLEQRWFDRFVTAVAEAEFRGHTLIELGQLERPGQLRNVTVIDPRNVLPHKGMVVRRQGDETGYPYREAPLQDYLIEVGEPGELGMLATLAPVAIIKKLAMGAWGDYQSKFGIPPRYIKTPERDKKRINQLEDMMRNMLSSAYAIIQSDEELHVMATPGTDAHQVFDALIVRCNSEMSKRVLGQDGTSDNKDASGTYGSLKVLQGVAEDRHQADKATVAAYVNNQLFPRLVKLGYPLAGVRFAWDELRDLAPMDMIEAAAKLSPYYDLDIAHLEQRTGIKITGVRRMPGEAAGGNTRNPRTSGRQGGGAAGQGHEEPDDDDTDGATASWPARHMAQCSVCGGHRGGIVAMGMPVVGQAALEQLLTDVHNGATWSQPYFEEVAGILTDAATQDWRHELGQINYDAPDHVARTAMEANIFRFGAAKTQAIALELNAIARDSSGLADYRRRVQESGLMEDYNQAWLQTEYVNAVNTGVQASRWYQMQRSADVLPVGEYFTAGDLQVRPTHRDLEGKRWPLSDPIWNTIWPPNGWGCRCTVLPVQDAPAGDALKEQTADVMEKLEGSGELQRMRKNGFAANRAKTGQAFDLAKSYRDQLGQDAGRPVSFGLRDSYGDGWEAMRWSELSKQERPSVPNVVRDADQARAWFKQAANADGVVVLQDYAGRPVQLNEATLERKLNKEPVRARLVSALRTTLAQPDEVWLDSTGRSPSLVYLKFTGDGIVRVPVSIDQGNAVAIRSFYLDNVDSDRMGLLIKRYRK